jgi:tRNA-dihydrouridine synthase
MIKGNKIKMKSCKVAKNFWGNLPKPFFVLAPMANVTDSVFRRMLAKYGKPDVMWTEFVSADGLVSDGQKRLLVDLVYSEKERPIVAQLFTSHAEAMEKAAKLVSELGFDGLDVNMGCPDRSVEKQGGGAAMMKDQKKAMEVLAAARAGFSGPVSVKTRIGYNKIDMEWIRLLLEQRLPALTVHLRTRKEMSDVPAHWDLMSEIVEMRDEIQADMKADKRTLIIGNGDVESLTDGAAKCAKYGCDGVMIGRGVFGKPWFFEDISKVRKEFSEECRKEHHIGVLPESGQKSCHFSEVTQKTPADRLKIMLEHAKLFEKTYCGRKHLKNFSVMKKHFKAYVSGWDGAKELRAELMEAENVKWISKIVRSSGFL